MIAEVVMIAVAMIVVKAVAVAMIVAKAAVVVIAEAAVAAVIAEAAVETLAAAEIAACGAGGLSGKPLRERSTEVIRYLKQQSGNAFPVIGVGGIHTAQDAIEKLNSGADLVQVYTGFVYEGPGVASAICEGVMRTED